MFRIHNLSAGTKLEQMDGCSELSLEKIFEAVLTFSEATEAYNFIVGWNNESVEELRDAIVRVRESGYRLLVGHLPSTIRELSYSAETDAFLLRKLRESGDDARKLIAVDRRGNALVGDLDHLRLIYRQPSINRNSGGSSLPSAPRAT